jgi:saccharopine dehydrogenase-like NADP-dependent oxidoreductase
LLFRLRDLSLTKQAENDTLKKQCEILEHKVKILTKENENAKTDVTNMQTMVADLKEQVHQKYLNIFVRVSQIRIKTELVDV